MTIAMIPTGTIVLLLLLKVAPPWADTWSDVTWIQKLVTFGNEWNNFNVSTPVDFLFSVNDCDESHFYDGTKWVNYTVSAKDFRKFRADPTTVTIQIIEELVEALEVLNKQISTKVRVKQDYNKWAIASALPLVVCLLFTLVVWWREEEGWTKVLLLPVVFIGLYSQYKAIKIILIGLEKWPNRRMEEWQEEKGRFTREIASIEPVLEAMPSLLIQLTLLSTEMAALYLCKRPNPLGENPVLFLFSFSLSILLAVMGLNHFLKDGPCPFISSNQGYLDGFISKDFGALFFTTFLWFTAKCLILSGVVNSRGYTSIAGIEVPEGVHGATIVWASTLLLPHLIHAVILLALSTGWNIFSLILSFPSFIITPLFMPFMYKGSFSDDKYEFRVSVKQTTLNIILTFLLTPLTMVLYYMGDIWAFKPPDLSDYKKLLFDTYQERNDTVSINKYKEQFDLLTNYFQITSIMFVILPPILLVFSLLPAFHLLNNCFCGKSKSEKHRTNLTFRKIGRLAWQVMPEGDDIMEIVAVHTGDLQDQQADGLLEDNLGHANSGSNQEVKDKLDHEEGGNNLEIQNQDTENLQDQQADGLLEDVLDHANSGSNEEVEDKMNHEDGGNNLEIQNRDSGDLQDQQAGGLLEDNLDHGNSGSNEEAKDKLDHEEGGNNLEI